MAKEEMQAAIAALGLTMTADFVPWSKSRYAVAKPKLSDRSLNWRVTLNRVTPHGVREILTTDYTAGIGHCPSYSPSVRPTLEYAEKIATETETGRQWRPAFSGGGKAIAAPDLGDILNSLVLDASAIDSGTFEEWATEYGYDTDSRKAEAMYRACLETALKLRAALGEAGLQTLRDASQDY